MTEKNIEKTTPNFESALKELEAIVRKLEGGNADLESSIADYTRGMELKTLCEKKLAQAELKVDKITQNADGSPTLAPMDEG